MFIERVQWRRERLQIQENKEITDGVCHGTAEMARRDTYLLIFFEYLIHSHDSNLNAWDS